uniref:Uncharacterized protein n=1 Tax=Oryza glumipatula TaxID=40148 RepID=A0A0D9ZMB7_9ORYZ
MVCLGDMLSVACINVVLLAGLACAAKARVYRSSHRRRPGILVKLFDLIRSASRWIVWSRRIRGFVTGCFFRSGSNNRYSSVLRLVSNNSDEDFDREVYRLAHLPMLDDFTNFSSDDEFEYSSGMLVDSVSDAMCDDFSDEDFQYEVDATYYRVSKRTLKAGGLVGLEGGKLVPEIESEVICGKEKSIARTAHATLD